MTSRPLRVFLCHASQDKPIVRELYQRLKAENWIDPWLDKAKLLPGQDWELVIEKAVDDSDVVIVCLSSQSVSKEGFVQREIRYAYDLALEKPEDTIFLIPLRLDACAMPRKLRSFHWVDYFGKEKKNSYSDLLQALKLRYDQKLHMEETQDQEERKEKVHEKQPDYRRYGIVGILLLVFILSGLGLNSLINKQPEATSTPASQDITETSKPSTETSVSFTPTLGIGSTMVSEKDGMTSVYVPAGEFTMGSEDGEKNESPTHQVYLDAFWIDQTEITNLMYARCVGIGKCQAPINSNSVMRLNYYNHSEFNNYPVIFVDWNMAKTYCEWVGGRLPTEAEWEKAARGTDSRTYPWGSQTPNPNLLNYNGNNDDTVMVGSYPSGSSPYGAFDMAGNVWEWISDWYDKEYYVISSDANPTGPPTGQNKVIRGGSFSYTDKDVRVTSRFSYNPTDSFGSIGFRCIRSP